MPAHAFLHSPARHRGLDPVLCHAGRKRQDKERDAMLRLAGYVTLRYANFPTQQTLRTDVEQLLLTKAGVVSA